MRKVYRVITSGIEGNHCFSKGDTVIEMPEIQTIRGLPVPPGLSLYHKSDNPSHIQALESTDVEYIGEGE